MCVQSTYAYDMSLYLKTNGAFKFVFYFFPSNT